MSDPTPDATAADPPVDPIAADLGIPGLEDPVEVGVGGFATVYRAFQPTFRRTVAVKVMATHNLDEESKARFERECQAMGLLSEHPNIVTVYGAGFTAAGGRPYMVMAYLPGGSLADRLDERGPIDWQSATEIGVELSGALETAHRAEVIHRDIKPANVLVSSYGGAQLTDFGIARISGGHETQSGVITASMAHAPPEVLDGLRPTVTADVYSLGSTLFELMSGRPAFEQDGEESLVPMLRRILTQAPPDLRSHGVPEPVWRVIAKSMAKDPGARQASALAFGRELQAARKAAGLEPGKLVIPDELAVDTADDAPVDFVTAPVVNVPLPPGADFGLDRPTRPVGPVPAEPPSANPSIPQPAALPYEPSRASVAAAAAGVTLDPVEPSAPSPPPAPGGLRGSLASRTPEVPLGPPAGGAPTVAGPGTPSGPEPPPAGTTVPGPGAAADDPTGRLPAPDGAVPASPVPPVPPPVEPLATYPPAASAGAGRSRGRVVAVVVVVVLVLVAAAVAAVVFQSRGASTSAPPTTAGPSPTPTTPAGAPASGYTEADRLQFVSDCTNNGRGEGFCRCLFSGIEASVPYDRYVRFDQAGPGGGNPFESDPDLVRIVAECRREHPGEALGAPVAPARR